MPKADPVAAALSAAMHGKRNGSVPGLTRLCTPEQLEHVWKAYERLGPAWTPIARALQDAGIDASEKMVKTWVTGQVKTRG